MCSESTQDSGFLLWGMKTGRAVNMSRILGRAVA